jgi:hypothetical protein
MAALCEILHSQSAQSARGCKVEGAMQTYADLVELARICLKQAREANNPIVSAEFSFCIAVMAPCEEMLPPKWKSLVRNFFVPVPSTGNL